MGGNKYSDELHLMAEKLDIKNFIYKKTFTFFIKNFDISYFFFH